MLEQRQSQKLKERILTALSQLLPINEYISYAGCDFPYFIGKVISSSKQLFDRNPQEFKHNQGINVLTRHLAYDINVINKRVYVKDLKENEEKTIDYDKLIIATGASPIKPKIEGMI